MKYATVIDLRIVHSFYPDGRCPDFQIKPDLATKRWLANHRCVLRQYPDGVQVCVASEAERQPIVPWASNEHLVFHLRLANPEFPLFTNLDGFADNPAPVFTTEDAAEASALVLRLKRGTATQTERLVFPANSTRADFTLAGRPAGNSTASDFEVRGLPGEPTVTLNKEKQRINVATDERAEDRPFEITYPTRPSLDTGVFADVEIVTDQFAAAGAQINCEIHFEPLSARWRYYVVGDSAPKYRVDFGQKAAFEPSLPEENDPVVQSLREQYGKSASINCLTSKIPLQCLPSAPLGLLLTKEGQTGNAEALPPPPLRNLCRVDDKPAFFQIIRKTVNP